MIHYWHAMLLGSRKTPKLQNLDVKLHNLGNKTLLADLFWTFYILACVDQDLDLDRRLGQDVPKTGEFKKWYDDNPESVLKLAFQLDLPSTEIDLP